MGSTAAIMSARVALYWAACCAFLFSTAADATPTYINDIRPIFERSCYGCHGPDKQRSKYRLDVRDSALKGGSSGTAAIVPHDAKNSPLFQFVSGDDPEMQMPPKSSGMPALTAEEIELVRAWIDAGPNWPDEFAGQTKSGKVHWSLKPLERPAIPGTETNPIDAFIHAKLAENNLAPSPEADRKTLIRRLYFDLTGLPPAPEEVAAFLSDTDSNAYEKIVDRLLASPRYGERWARHWLDTIHFADSHGYEHDVARENAWRYRDYVIDAFNSDTDWARFIKEQLAADVFYPREPRSTAALGFLGAGTFDLSTYSTAPVTFDYLDRDDLVTQTMAAFVSTTANCARCHAHKFDPISQEDYYALQANFAGILKGDVAYDEDATVARERKRWNDLMAAADANNSSALLSIEQSARVHAWYEKRGTGATWVPLEVDTFLSSEGATLSRDENGVVVSSGTLPEKDTYTITAGTSLPQVTAIRLDVFSRDTLPSLGPGRNSNGNFHLSEFRVRLFEPGAPEAGEVKVARATADFNQADWGIERALDSNKGTAWGIHPEEGESHYAVFELVEPLEMKAGARLAILLEQSHGGGHVIGAFRLSAASGTFEQTVALPKAVEEMLSLKEIERTQEQQAVVAAAATRFIARDALAALPPQVSVYAAAKRVVIPAGDPAPKTTSLETPKIVNLMERGEFDKPRAEIPPGALSVLTNLPARFALKNMDDESERRADLAEWIAHRDNVLTWRSVVNRVWHYHFGRGICDTPSDFGEMGGTPSHPELIDWLAVWFRDDARGSLKQLHKLIMMSATYRQSSANREVAAQIDGDNRLLWRQNRQRLDADAYRDFVLAISGRLDLKMGGPGIKQFTQAKGPQLTPALDYSAYCWSEASAGRRSIYRFVWRGIADPFMEALDFPDLGLLSPTRGFSASALQALALYNNDFVLSESEALARRVEGEASTLEQQAILAVQLAWLREVDAPECSEFVAYANTNGLAALCRVLLNSNEFLFVD
ncbi:MAG: PSD1 domain-containing protein [Candidatus Hydrogenedentes bacterium]|nr:PSD1 domain-containing protein [Candidatus Hydrogenedentota bacterium]